MSQCLKCKSLHTYQEGSLWICPECGHEWSAIERRGFKRTFDSSKKAVVGKNGPISKTSKSLKKSRKK